jgi:hypothetical protein
MLFILHFLAVIGAGRRDAIYRFANRVFSFGGDAIRERDEGNAR